MIDNVCKATRQEIPLAELVEIRVARRPGRVEEYPFGGSWPYIDIKALETAVPSRYTDGTDSIMGVKDLVLVKDGFRCGKVFHGMEGVAASTLTILSPLSYYVSMDYLYCYLAYRYDDFQKKKKGTTIGHLDMRYLKNLLVPVPDEDAQKEISEKYQRIESMAKETSAKALQLKELAVAMGNKDLKTASENLNKQVELMRKAWLYQIFKKEL